MRELLRNMKKNQGVTLIALIVTIVILLILVSIVINMTLTQDGLFARTKNALNIYQQAELNEKMALNNLDSQIEKAEKDYVKTTVTGGTGNWDDNKKVNIPKLDGTGLIPVILANDGSVTEVTDLTSDWYDYNTTADSSRWANAITKDKSGNITGYFVWIPRYAYKITSGCYTSTAGSIQIKFLQGTSDKDSTGATISRNYPTVTSGVMADYVVHPAFTNNVSNGGWNSELSGFWVAKYQAGYQKSTIDTAGNITNGGDTLVESNITYTSVGTITKNAVNNTLTTGTKISYPVFKPLTYAYNCIIMGDSYKISREIQGATDFYGLSNIDSHMEKNSEWGAVAYLAQSNYGRSGVGANINNFNRNLATYNVYGVTGLYGAAATTAVATAITAENPYNTTIGMKGSSTGNITGVYDLNGCLYERVAGYITNGNANLKPYESLFTYITSDPTPQLNNRSTKWATAYPYNKTSDTYANNWTKYKSLKTATYGYGDAILEISTAGSGNTAWNGDDSYYGQQADTFMTRGGTYSQASKAGMFAFSNTEGGCYQYHGFRVVLVP